MICTSIYYSMCVTSYRVSNRAYKVYTIHNHKAQKAYSMKHADIHYIHIP